MLNNSPIFFFVNQTSKYSIKTTFFLFLFQAVGVGNDVHAPAVPHRPTFINNQTSGYFISQDSSFGNTILPVLPRFE